MKMWRLCYTKYPYTKLFVKGHLDDWYAYANFQVCVFGIIYFFKGKKSNLKAYSIITNMFNFTFNFKAHFIRTGKFLAFLKILNNNFWGQFNIETLQGPFVFLIIVFEINEKLKKFIFVLFFYLFFLQDVHFIFLQDVHSIAHWKHRPTCSLKTQAILIAHWNLVAVVVVAVRTCCTS